LLCDPGRTRGAFARMTQTTLDGCLGWPARLFMAMQPTEFRKAWVHARIRMLSDDCVDADLRCGASRCDDVGMTLLVSVLGLRGLSGMKPQSPVHPHAESPQSRHTRQRPSSRQRGDVQRVHVSGGMGVLDG
jgi:hypothetical protein